MALYNEIKNAFDDDNLLVNLIDIYHKGYIQYYELTQDPKYNKNMHQEYLDNFNTYIKNPSLEKIYNYIVKNVDKLDDQIKNMIDSIEQRTDIDDDEKFEQRQKINFILLYPLSQHSSFFNRFKNFKEIEDFVKKHNLDNLRHTLNMVSQNLFQKEKKEAREELKKAANLSDKEVDLALYVERIRKILHSHFKHDNTMGFHINPEAINPDNNISNKYKKNINIKFYINAGVDSYQFASILQKKCEERNLEYMYKVVDAWIPTSEDRRCDKICIWTSYKYAETFVEMLREIKREHPEFDYQKPPMICGLVDDFIGVGIDFGNSSFNHAMSMLCTDALENTFGKISKEEILKIISKDHNKLNEFRNEIKRLAKENGLDTTKLCVTKDAKEQLAKYQKTENKVEKTTKKSFTVYEEETKLYIKRGIYEHAKKLNIQIEGIPKIIENSNCYSITKEQLDEYIKVTKFIPNIQKINKNDKVTKDIHNKEVNKNKKTTPNTSYIIIYNDKYNNKKYIKEEDLGYKKDNPTIIMGNTCYEISDKEIAKITDKKVIQVSVYLHKETRINKQITIISLDNNLYISEEHAKNINLDNKNRKKLEIYGVIYTSITKEELATLKQKNKEKGIDITFKKRPIIEENNNHSDEYIPGTNIYKPRNRGIYETDEEYERFLKTYYDSVFKNKDNELKDMFKEDNSKEDSKEKNK